MQQPGVVWVLDVFHHQLPVARNTLAVVAQQRQFSAAFRAFEDALKPGEYVGAKISFQRLGVVAESRKNQSVQRSDAQLGKAMILQIKI